MLPALQESYENKIMHRKYLAQCPLYNKCSINVSHYSLLETLTNVKSGKFLIRKNSKIPLSYSEAIPLPNFTLGSKFFGL